jgi:CheY-like chemotaxis protein
MPAAVIVVHPDPNTRALALTTLRAAGLEVAGFEDPIVALDTIEADGRSQLLVTAVDFGSGKLNGAALVRMLKYKRRGIKAVFLSAPEQAEHVAEDGATLLEPVDPLALLEAVARLLLEPAGSAGRVRG